MIKSFNEMRKIDVSKLIKKRDGADYLNWAVVKQLLHDNGAEKVIFDPIRNENGSSLIMSDQTFETGSEGTKRTNRCYETRIKITIDDLEFEMQGPVMNGANPVQDNSMTQQRLWNSQTRLFVKGVAIYTGLGFDLWQKQETEELEKEEDDLSKHSIMKVAQRVKELLTLKMQEGLSMEEIAIKVGITEDELKAQLCYYSTLDRLEKAISKIDTK